MQFQRVATGHYRATIKGHTYDIRNDYPKPCNWSISIDGKMPQTFTDTLTDAQYIVAVEQVKIPTLERDLAKRLMDERGIDHKFGFAHLAQDPDLLVIL